MLANLEEFAMLEIFAKWVRRKESTEELNVVEQSLANPEGPLVQALQQLDATVAGWTAHFTDLPRIVVEEELQQVLKGWGIGPDRSEYIDPGELADRLFCRLQITRKRGSPQTSFFEVAEAVRDWIVKHRQRRDGAPARPAPQLLSTASPGGLTTAQTRNEVFAYTAAEWMELREKDFDLYNVALLVFVNRTQEEIESIFEPATQSVPKLIASLSSLPTVPSGT